MPEQPEEEVIVVAQQQSDGSTLVEIIEVHSQQGGAEGVTTASDSEGLVEIIEALLDSEGDVEGLGAAESATTATDGGVVVEVHEFVIAADGEVTEGEDTYVIDALPVDATTPDTTAPAEPVAWDTSAPAPTEQAPETVGGGMGAGATSDGHVTTSPDIVGAGIAASPDVAEGGEAVSAGVSASTGTTEGQGSGNAGPTQAELEAQAEIEGHAIAAQHAQERADADVAAGDYHAAAQERESAESEAWEASDSGMLHGSSAVELEAAADRQADAQYYEHQEAQHAAAGDYSAARDDAANAANQQGWADYYAGGTDHTGQARAEYAKEDNAVWQEGQAKQDAQDAQWYADHGNADAAENYANSAVEHQALADQYGHEGQHGAVGAVHDASSDVAHDTPVGDASADAAAHTEEAVAYADDTSSSSTVDDSSADAPDDGAAE